MPRSDHLIRFVLLAKAYLLFFNFSFAFDLKLNGDTGLLTEKLFLVLKPVWEKNHCKMNVFLKHLIWLCMVVLVFGHVYHHFFTSVTGSWQVWPKNGG